MAYKTNLLSGGGSFADMMQKFGVVTVMNAKVFDTSKLADGTTIAEYFANKTAYTIASLDETSDGYICTLDTLKTANVTVDGPDKSITGGQYGDTLVKFGKSARLEIQDALGNCEALEALCGGVQEWKYDTQVGDLSGVHFGEDFSGPKTIVGDSFFIDQKTGKQVTVTIVFYQFLPDSLFNLTQDATGDAAVFDMNGDLLTTKISLGDGTGKGTIQHGVFYSIVDSTLTA